MIKNNIEFWSPEVGIEEQENLIDVIKSGYINDGKVTSEFETQIKSFVGAEYGIGTSSCTTALYMCLKALNIGEGDEVLAPNLTFVATINAIAMTGAKPILVDADPDSTTMCIDSLEKKISDKSKAIIPVHVSGRGGNISKISLLAKKHNIPIIEDAAEALGSKHGEKYLGTIGQMGCFSFSPNKTITTGQGGMIVTNRKDLEVRLRELKDQGRASIGTGGDDLHPVFGSNFKLTNLQSAVGMAQFKKLKGRLENQKKIFQIYKNEIDHITDIEIIETKLNIGEIPQWTDILIENPDSLYTHLKNKKMNCRKFWLPINQQDPYRCDDSQYEKSIYISSHCIWLPSAYQLSQNQVLEVCKEVKNFFS